MGVCLPGGPAKELVCRQHFTLSRIGVTENYFRVWLKQRY
jgi:hypothetical protein